MRKMAERGRLDEPTLRKDTYNALDADNEDDDIELLIGNAHVRDEDAADAVSVKKVSSGFKKKKRVVKD